MDKVTIKWKHTSLSEIADVMDADLYAMSLFDNVIYIGKAYHSEARQRILSNIKDFGINKNGLVLWLGHINYEKTDYKRITEKIILDCECLLILCNQPSYNYQCKKIYNLSTHRDNLYIKSNHSYLYKYCQVKKGKVSKSNSIIY